MKLSLNNQMLTIQIIHPTTVDCLLTALYQNKKRKYLLYQQHAIKVNQTIIKQSKPLLKNDIVTIHLLLDEDDRYYIFKGNSNNQDEIYLDTYTVDLPEFLEKYNSSDDGYKVGYNIEKFFNAINDKDYKYAYNVLDDVFKQNNYPNQSDFENFVKSNFYENNKVNHKNVEQEGNLFVYNISIQNKENLGEQKNLTVIMKLEEGTDFVMSFSIDN